MADPTTPDGGSIAQIGAAAGAFIAALLAWYAALRKKPDAAAAGTAISGDGELRTQLLVSELKQVLHAEAEDARENLRLVLEAHKTSVNNGIGRLERDMHSRLDGFGERLRQLELSLASRGRFSPKTER